MLVSNENGSDVVIAGQKTGWIFALDPNDGSVVWRRSISRGDYNKANWWGMALDQSTVFAAVNNLYADPVDGPYLGIEELGLYALDAFTGQWRWTAPVSRDCEISACKGYGAALTAIPGRVVCRIAGWFFQGI